MSKKKTFYVLLYYEGYGPLQDTLLKVLKGTNWRITCRNGLDYIKIVFNSEKDLFTFKFKNVSELENKIFEEGTY